MSRPPFNLSAVEAATAAGLQAGKRLFQTHRFARSDVDQVAFLLELMDPPGSAVVLDAGCGVGEVSKIMADMRQDLAFVLANVSPMQLGECPVGERFLPMLTDCHDLDINDSTLDAVIFSSALCQMDTEQALSEAGRVLKAGGILLINDMARERGDGTEMETILAARVLSLDELKFHVEAAGFSIDAAMTPAYDDQEFRDLLRTDNLEHLIEGIFPVVIRATKKEVKQ